MPLPSLEALTTVAGAAIAVAVLFEVLKRALNPDPVVLDRFGPVAAMVLGVVVVLFASLVLNVIHTPADIGNIVLNGCGAGLMAIGFFKTVKNTLLGG